eukprot:CAMPEP_0183718262 /NCGR_PEP_ID=MMETSP0737-20130205/11572_1 /TAXON_ID=385413 /ORGANISM="Thalassiosira miniscula, Strain CCMP1093" /LENGTH=958 /DNA_ID=CAMNT_0025947793 /DNA_START=543 /DNA_END=3419 /DNA_ORIENTATION=+
MEAKRRGVAKANSTKKSQSESMLPEYKGHPNARAGASDSDSEQSDNESMEEIPSDDLIVQILARLDGPSYNQALHQDARSISENFLIPPHFPWHSRTRLPQKMMKTLPRDIDDLQVISHCQDKLHAPYGDFQGPFGFGRYENGQSRGNYSNVPPAQTLSLKAGSMASAAARRSHDPGIIELNVQIPLPSSIDAIANSKEQGAPTTAGKWEAELLHDPDCASMLRHLPYRWVKRGHSAHSHSTDHLSDHPHRGKTETHAEINGSDFKSHKLNESRSNSRAQLDLAKYCTRKWKISTKVGGVSSRSSLFPPSTRAPGTAGAGDQGPENTRKVIRPMLCLASLPQSIQTGQTVSTEKAMEMDAAGFAHSLGSYDCRFTEALLNPKRDSINRAKRIEVGRTRLVWSNLIQGEESQLPSARSRLNFNSLITGQRVDPSKFKRPTEVKVGVRLNGRIVMEEAYEGISILPTSNIRKRKHSTRQAENESPALKPRAQYSEFRKDEEIDAALDNHCKLQARPQDERFIQQGAENGTVVYLETENSSRPDIDRNDIIASLLKFNQKKTAQKKLKQSASSDAMLGGSQSIKKCNPPRFACVPLEDGLIRTVCLSAGNLGGTAVHQVIREVSDQDSGRRCSVCWSDEGSGKEGVQECVKCGLLVHLNCCLDKGKFSTVSNKSSKESADGILMHSNPNAKAGIESFGGENIQWQCAVCCRYTEMKPRRNPRKPSRFVDGETYALSNYTGNNDILNRNPNVPGPRCYLCPHRGGAMSPLESSNDSDHSRKWAHEVCRIWSGLDSSIDSKSKEFLLPPQEFPNGSPLSNVCALCGTGGLKTNKTMQFNAGLTRCAARGCYVAFHPMCALLALQMSKVGTNSKSGKAKSVRTRKTRHTEQAMEEKKSDFNEYVEADKNLCKEYTLQLVQLTRNLASSASEEEQTTIIPVSFCGIHNPQREDYLYGCPPGGASL